MSQPIFITQKCDKMVVKIDDSSTRTDIYADNEYTECGETGLECEQECVYPDECPKFVMQKFPDDAPCTCGRDDWWACEEFGIKQCEYCGDNEDM